jgi:ubiquinone biosynthesis protein
MIGTIVNLARLVRIGRTLARHDALSPIFSLSLGSGAGLGLVRRISRTNSDLRSGVRLAAAFQELGPTFIKLGQAMSVRADLVGDELAEDLSALQDRLPPFPSAAAKSIIEEEFGAPVEDLFQQFDDEPIAAASIAQVHFAVTTEGQKVAVKVLRPRIEEQFQRDIDLFFWLARTCERLRPRLRRLQPVEVVLAFQHTVSLEMDMTFEGAAASELRENFIDDPEFHVPQVDWLRTARRVLTTDRVEGLSIDEVDALEAAGLDMGEILARSARAFFNQVFRDGFFHADMHPGNMFVAPDGALVPVDFGIMGRLDKRTRFYLADMLLGFLERDYRRVTDVHFAAGYVPHDQSVDAFMLACRSIGEPIFGKPMHEISIAKLFGQLFRITERFEMQTQPQLLLLQKTMLVAEGVGRKLDPSSNMWVLAQSMIEAWMLENRGPEARAREVVNETVLAIERLPSVMAKTEAVVDMLSDGGLRLHPDSLRALSNKESWRGPGLFFFLALAMLLVGIVAIFSGQ